MISVVVPVYNVSKYLEKCIVSILNQTYRNLEVIIVDDGSTDGSSQICDQLAMEDNRITVIHKKNGGLVSARKAGISIAKGKYVINIDSDDWIELNMIHEMLVQAIANDADIVTSGYYGEYGGTHTRIVDSILEGCYSNKNELEYLYRHLIFNGTVEKSGILPNLVCKLIKSSLLQDVYLKLSNEAIIAEDAAIIYSCCVIAKKIVVTHNIYYHYVMRSSSIIHSKSKFFFKNINSIYLFLDDFFGRSDNSSDLMEQLNVYIVKLAFVGINSLGLGKWGNIPEYDFPKRKIPFDSKIVLYGAGRVGRSYYKHIYAEKLYQLAGWIDEQYQEYQKEGIDVLPVETLKDMEYDYILIALKRYELVRDVKEHLKKEFNADETKILWFEPINIIDKYSINEYGIPSFDAN